MKMLPDSQPNECPVLRTFLRTMFCWVSANQLDCVRSEMLDLCSERIVPAFATLYGSQSTPAVEERRRYMACDWALRESAPSWIEAAPGLSGQVLRDSPEVESRAAVEAIRPACVLLQQEAKQLKDRLLASVEAGEESVDVLAPAYCAFMALNGVILALSEDHVQTAATAAGMQGAVHYAVSCEVGRAVRGADLKSALRSKVMMELMPTATRTYESGLRCVERMLAVR